MTPELHPELPSAEWTPEYALKQIDAALDDDGTQGEIAHIGLQLVSLLLQKNLEYGDSALDPVRIFAKHVDPLVQLHVRMDDKLSRVQRGDQVREDAIFDLAGYCILEIVARKRLIV